MKIKGELNLVLVVLFCLSLIFTIGCKDDIETATLKTGEVTNITSISATVSGNVLSDGGATVISRGICWSNATSEPKITENGFMHQGSGEGAFTCDLIGLLPSTKYYARAYATNSEGTAYGNTVEFTTIDLTGDVTTPTITTSQMTNIGSTSAIAGGEITNEGGLTILTKGVCWSKTSQEPTIADLDFTVFDNSSDNPFTCNLSLLLPNTKYYVRAFASNLKGTAYGNTVEFTTESIMGANVPTVSTKNITDITKNSAKSGGEITNDGGNAVTSRGVCWSTDNNPTVNNSKTLDGDGAGGFNSEITGLVAGTKYYLRAYATNSEGTGYGSVLTFSTNEEGALLGNWSSNIMLTMEHQISWTTYNGTRVDTYENTTIGFKYQANNVSGIVLATTSNCSGWVLVDNNNYVTVSELEEAYNAGTVITSYELPYNYEGKSYSERIFIAKVDDEYILVNTVDAVLNTTTGNVVVFKYKSKQ